MGSQDQAEGPLPHTFGVPQQKSDESPQCNIPQPPSPGNPPPPYERGHFGLNLPLPNVNDNDTVDHRSFVSNVYRFLTYQLTGMMPILYFFTFDTGILHEIRNNPAIWWFSFNLLVVTLVLLGYNGDKRRLWPKTSLITFTIALTFFLGCTIASNRSRYPHADDPVVSFFYGEVISLAIIFALTKFAMQTKREFTFKRSIHLMVAVAFLSFGVLCMLDPYHAPVPAFFGYIQAMIFCTYVVYYTQVTMKEEHRNTASSPYRTDGSKNSLFIIACLDIYVNMVNTIINFISNIFKLTKEDTPERSKNLLSQGVSNV